MTINVVKKKILKVVINAQVVSQDVNNKQVGLVFNDLRIYFTPSVLDSIPTISLKYNFKGIRFKIELLIFRMRLLKNKIIASQTKHNFHNHLDDDFPINELGPTSLPKKSKKGSGKSKTKVKPRSRRRKASNLAREELANKNIVKNFGRAIANFAGSHIAVPYIELGRTNEKFNTAGFIEFSLGLREYILNFETFKDVLVITSDDDEERISFKNMFSFLAQIFIKYFSVNWVFTGKMLYKPEYIAARGPLLRRIRNPERYDSLSQIILREQSS